MEKKTRHTALVPPCNMYTPELKTLATQGGFSLMELIVAIAITLILVSMSLTGLYTFSSGNSNAAAARAVAGALQEAHARTLASDGGTAYGIFLETTTITLFPGSVYVAGDPANDVRTLPTRTLVTNVALSGGATEVSFARLTGIASATGTIEVAGTRTPSNTSTIRIHESGLIEVE